MCVGVVVYVGVCRGSSACEVIVGVCIRVVVVYVVVLIVYVGVCSGSNSVCV